VISARALAQYQLLFRHLFELKCVERELNGIWQIYQATRALYRYLSVGITNATLLVPGALGVQLDTNADARRGSR
jgi:Gamma tubulin complex component C-terminal